MELRWRELCGHVAPEACAGAGARECRSQARGGRQLAGCALDQRPAVSACMEVAKLNPPCMERGRELRSKGISSPGVLPMAMVPIPVTPWGRTLQSQRHEPGNHPSAGLLERWRHSWNIEVLLGTCCTPTPPHLHQPHQSSRQPLFP